MPKQKIKTRTRITKKVQKGVANINATYNNTIISIADQNGNVLAWSSAGSAGFKGTRKSTQFAASKMAEIVAEKAKKFGLEEISVFVKGIGSGRESAIRGLANSGLSINLIRDITPMPHNGCKPKKARRV